MSVDTAHAFTSVPAVTLASDFEVRVLAVDRARATVRLRGDFDLASAPLLLAVLQHHLDCGLRDVRLDLSGVTFLDCSGLGTIVSVHNEVRTRGGQVTLTGVGARVARLLRLTALDSVLEIAPARPR